MEKIEENEDKALQSVLNRILFLAGYSLIDKYLVYFYQGGYLQGEEATRLIRDLILKLCSELKNDSIALIDSIAPPDYVLNSSLGNSDGLVYKHLYNSMIQAPGCFERLSWFDDFMDKKKFGSRRTTEAKL
jgi:acyl-CoA oxidase